ncbi:hypothetical protein B9T19_02700 [Ignatzschineria sp. F8392]|uniref:DUF6270 domain-containing protein n=1 Tax=Ignatzschineria sp. F8392 TaxID=1980117 RepID=UPI000B97D135|nr:DUF6270 domain-containing protein [Ignatzschineria sp. F8392]OYQ81597.1 hypothetical protein B9T19_02700 [Ignatzschineria sp. F8392]
MKNIFVYGGCVSRDIFNKPYNKGDIRLSGYIARYSIAKLQSKPIKLNVDVNQVPSAFQRRVIEIDAKNNLLSYVSKREYDYFLIDFLFSRFSLVEYNSGLLTYSAELQKSKILTSKNKIISPDTEVYWEYFKQGLKIFVSHLELTGNLEKLLINKVYLATKDELGEDFSNLDKINKQNDFLSRVYDLLDNYISSNQYLEYSSKLFTGAVNHPWGKNPMHFIPEFYEESYNKISSL